ncbi:MAG TPA: ORF6N domain-containing protein [Proteobacteria bacterium]|nr:ORF6N domain-containing protein [Pseudomonadota bacterium]
MTNAVVINNREVQMIMYKNQPVVTLEMVDKLHERPEGTARRNFNENRSRFIQAEDYFNLPYREWQSMVVRNSYDGHDKRGHYGKRVFLAESGYLMLVKSFNDDLAWKVQRELVNRYFRSKVIGNIQEHLQEYVDVCVKASVEASLKVCQAMFAGVSPQMPGVFSQPEGKDTSPRNSVSNCYGLKDFEFLPGIDSYKHPAADSIVLHTSLPIGVFVGKRFFVPEKVEYTPSTLTKILKALIRTNDPSLADFVFNRLHIYKEEEDFHTWALTYLLSTHIYDSVPRMPGLREFADAYARLENKSQPPARKAKEVPLEQILPPRLVATQMLFPAEDHPEIARCLLAEEDPKQAAVNFLAKTGTDPKDLYIWIAGNFAA